MGIKELINNDNVTIKFYGVKDDKGVLFYNARGIQIDIPEFNKYIDNFLLNPIAKILICFEKCDMQLSDLLVDYFPDNDVIDDAQEKIGRFTILE